MRRLTEYSGELRVLVSVQVQLRINGGKMKQLTVVVFERDT